MLYIDPQRDGSSRNEGDGLDVGGKTSWRLMSYTVGFIPAPVLLVLVLVLAGLWATNALSGEIMEMIAVLGLAGCILYEIGARIPLINRIGGPVVLATFVPAYLVAHSLMPPALVEGISNFWDGTKFVYLYVTAVIVGSILSMNRRVLIAGFIRIFVPLTLGSIAATIVGVSVGWLLGLDPRDTLLFIVVPIMAGGIGEGAIPLTLGYADVMGQDQGVLLAQVLPAIMLGNLTAIILAGMLDQLGKSRPDLTGNGHLQVSEEILEESFDLHDVTPHHVAGALMIGAALYMIGLLVHALIGLPGPVALLVLAVLLKLSGIVPPHFEAGARSMYRFFALAVTYPLLFAVGTVITPWEQLVAAFSPASIVTIVATVLTLAVTGFAVSRATRLHAVEAALINICHSGMGGAGDIAILTSANRLALLPFAQIATRIGGAITVTVTIILLHHFS